MRNVTLFISTSADGKIAREDGDTDWVQSPSDIGFDKFYSGIDTLLMGRSAFEKQLSKGPWPFGDKKTFVFSKTLKNQYSSEIEIINRDPSAFLEDLKPSVGKNIWLVGGAKLIRTLMNENIVDEAILNLHPVMLGKGIDLFPLPLHSMFWRLDSSTELPSGLVQVRYAFVGSHDN